MGVRRGAVECHRATTGLGQLSRTEILAAKKKRHFGFGSSAQATPRIEALRAVQT